MREALETPGKTTALITPNQSIARRVAAELRRWDVEVEDSAGRTLGQSPAGALARLVLEAAIAFTPRALLALLAHPAARFGRTQASVESAARALELAVFRAVPVASLDDLEAAFVRAREAAADRRAHPAIRRIGATERERAETLARDVALALRPLRALGPAASLRDCLALHRSAIEEATAGPRAAAEESGHEPSGLEAVLDLIDEWREAAAGDFSAALREYAVLLDDALAAERAPLAGGGHPRLMILGLLEARLLCFDCALLAGLDETVWPPAVETDAFLNRPMRAALGLTAPERRIGQTAHDFVAALGAREAILSRAKKRGGEPTVASRFLQRLAAAAGAGSPAYAKAQARGERFLAFARALDRPKEVKPVRRPAPTPPIQSRPQGLSVTRIETLRRDPYAIYAEYILRLKALEPVEREIGPREAGVAWHAALEAFARDCPSGALAPDARKRLHAIARERFAHLRADPAFAALNWPQIELGLDYFLDFERRSREDVRRVWVERDGAIAIPLASGREFKLSARADRIDELRSGEARLIDYKSGSLPGVREVEVGFSPQLTLEAAILERGGFEGLPALKTAEALYLKLGGASGGGERAAAGDEKFAPLVEKHFAELKRLIDQFDREGTPYLSRPFPQFASRYSDYDHLARVKEWANAEGDDEAAEPA
jgi:ATP-dependent helicase/nuclease subunit B